MMLGGPLRATLGVAMEESSKTGGAEDQPPRPTKRDASGPVLICLRIEPGEPITGTLASSGQAGMSFCGWMDLIAAITVQRDRQRQ